jgi:hypothetical protein
MNPLKLWIGITLFARNVFTQPHVIRNDLSFSENTLRTDGHQFGNYNIQHDSELSISKRLPLSKKIELLPPMLVMPKTADQKTNQTDAYLLLKTVYDNVIENDNTFCKLHSIAQLSERFNLPSLKIEVPSKKMFSANKYLPDQIACYALDYNQQTFSQEHFCTFKSVITINPDLLDPNWRRLSEQQQQKLLSDIEDAMTHEIQHAFMTLKNIETLCSLFKDESKLRQHLHFQNMTKDELIVAPYKTSKQKLEFIKVIQKGEERLQALLQLMEKCKKNTCDQNDQAMIRFFQNDFSDYNWEKRYFSLKVLDQLDSKIPLENLLKALTLLRNKVVPDFYKEDILIAEFDAMLHGMMMPLLQSAQDKNKNNIFYYIFKELLTWHEQYAPDSYNQCLQALEQGHAPKTNVKRY